MLAQNFKTAADLGISEAEVGALIKVLGMLERGEISDEHFDMGSVWSDYHQCGAVGCLCGWANHISKGAAFPEICNPAAGCFVVDRIPASAIDLFAMYGARDQVRVQRNGRPASAAIALRSYLTTGEANWREALA